MIYAGSFRFTSQSDFSDENKYYFQGYENGMTTLILYKSARKIFMTHANANSDKSETIYVEMQGDCDAVENNKPKL